MDGVEALEKNFAQTKSTLVVCDGRNATARRASLYFQEVKKDEQLSKIPFIMGGPSLEKREGQGARVGARRRRLHC